MSDSPENKIREPLPTVKRVFRIEVAPSTLIIIVLVVFGVSVLNRLLPVILVLISALMIVGTLNPAVQWLEGRRIPRGVAIAINFSVLLLVLVLLGIFIVPALVTQVSSLIEQEPQLRTRLADFLSGYPLTESFAGTLRNFQYAALIKSFGAEVLAFSKNFLQIVAYGAGAFFLALYMMIDRDRLRGALFAVTPRAQHIHLSRILLNLETIVGGYVRGQVVTCVLMGVFLFVVLTACDVPNALAIAAFGGIADVLPFVGIFLTMIPAVLAALAKGTLAVGIVFVSLLFYEEFESRVLIPIVYGRALRLPSSIVFFALIVGGTLHGIVGALLALPVAATILMLVDELRVVLPGEAGQTEILDAKEKDAISEAEYSRRTKGMPAEEAAAIALEISGNRKKEESDRESKSH